MNRIFTRFDSVWRTALAASLLISAPLAASPGDSDEWKFTVLLNDDSIGYHHFSLDYSGDKARLTTRADFDVTFLKIPLFSYEHENTEVWNNRCLERIESSTDQNGDLYTVNGVRTDSGFRLKNRDGVNTLPACVSTFAYWDMDFLKRKKLLNSQTGEYVDVSTDYLGESQIEVGDTRTAAKHFRITADDMVIDLWYSQNNRWLALETLTSTGSVLRYIADLVHATRSSPRTEASTPSGGASRRKTTSAPVERPIQSCCIFLISSSERPRANSLAVKTGSCSERSQPSVHRSARFGS